jgi:hypothetical protein
VRFSHDLLGDWARMRVLIVEQSTSSPSNPDRAILSRSHHAVRLLGWGSATLDRLGYTMRFVRNDWVPGAKAVFEKFADYVPKPTPAVITASS